MTEVIHYVGWASQPYVEILCTEEHSYVCGGFVKEEVPLPEGVHRCDAGLYTFAEEGATCTDCLKIMREGPPKYKACRSCKKYRDERDFELARRCNICEGTGIVRENKSYSCNKCGGTMKATEDCSDSSPHGLVEVTVGGGYHSFYLSDCTSYTFSMCEKCLREAFEEFKIPPTVVDRMGDGSKGPEESYQRDREAYLHQVWCASGGRKEAFKAGLCTDSETCGKPARWGSLDRPPSYKPGKFFDASCDDHVPWHLNTVNYRTLPIEQIIDADAEELAEAWDRAPDQFPSKRYTEEVMATLCKGMLESKWEAWSKIRIPTMNNSTPEELLEQGYACWVYTLLQVFVQRREIPYFSESTG